MVNKYIITTAQYNAPVNNELLINMEKYAKDNGAEILILPTTGKNITEDELLASSLRVHQQITRDYNINDSLRIRDFGARPQQINPLTGLERFAQGDKSYIMPGTKQVLKYVANSYDEIPKAIMTTGSITHPHYNLRHRTGKIAKQDHEYGFIVVEKDDDKFFHFRHVKSLKNGTFSDINGSYRGGKKTKPKVKAMVIGDLHPYDLDPIHKKVTFEQIRELKPEAIFLHDTFNGKSINRHNQHRNIAKHKAYEEQGLNLERELRDTLKELRTYCSVAKHSKVYVVASNHDEWLYNYLDEGRFIGDKGNDLMASQLYTGVLKGENALKYGLSLVGKLPSNLEFIERDTGHKVLGYELGNHGDLGANGGRGSPRSIENANGKSITGHSHSAFKVRDTYKVGTSTKLRLDYNKGYSNWTQTNAVLYDTGTVQLLNTINKKWRK